MQKKIANVCNYFLEKQNNKISKQFPEKQSKTKPTTRPFPAHKCSSNQAH